MQNASSGCLFLVKVSIHQWFLNQNQFLHPGLKEIRFRPTINSSSNRLVVGATNRPPQNSSKAQADHRDRLIGITEQGRWLLTTQSIERLGYLLIISTKPSHYPLDMNKRSQSKDRYIFFMYLQVTRIFTIYILFLRKYKMFLGTHKICKIKITLMLTNRCQYLA